MGELRRACKKNLKKVEKMKDLHSYEVTFFFSRLDVNHTVTFEKSSKDLSLTHLHFLAIYDVPECV